jgi:hypothetical protein
MAFYIAAGAFAVLQFLAENPAVTLALADEVALLRQRLSARPAWANGPQLDLDQARLFLRLCLCLRRGACVRACARVLLRRRACAGAAAPHARCTAATQKRCERAWCGWQRARTHQARTVIDCPNKNRNRPAARTLLFPPSLVGAGGA